MGGRPEQWGALDPSRSRPSSEGPGLAEMLPHAAQPCVVPRTLAQNGRGRRAVPRGTGCAADESSLRMGEGVTAAKEILKCNHFPGLGEISVLIK